MRKLLLIAATLAASLSLALPAAAQDTDTGHLSTEYEKAYKWNDGTYSRVVDSRRSDGGDATQGAKADTVCATDTGTCSVIALLKRLAQKNALPGVAGTPSTEVLTVQGSATGTPLPSALYSAAGTALSVSSGSSDSMPVNSTNLLGVNAYCRIWNGTASTTGGSRCYQIDVATNSGTGVMAMATAGSSFTNVTSATTTTIKTGAGIWQNMSVNTPAAGTITCYANTAGSGTKIGTWTTTTGQPFSITLNYYFTTGLTCVTSAVMDVTFGYR